MQKEEVKKLMQEKKESIHFMSGVILSALIMWPTAICVIFNISAASGLLINFIYIVAMWVFFGEIDLEQAVDDYFKDENNENQERK